MSYGSRFLHTWYYALPSGLKDVVASGYGLIERRARYGWHYFRFLRFLEESQWWENDALVAYQRDQVEQFLRATLQATPYYSSREVYRTAQNIEQLPLLPKQEVRKHVGELRSSLRMKTRVGQTSGTTGTPLTFPISMECFQREYAFRALHYSWGGVRLNSAEKIAICAGHPIAFHGRTRPPFWVHDHANRWLLLSSYHLTQKNLRAYVKELELYQPVLIGGYPSSIYLLAAAYLRYGQVSLPLRAVFTGSETLFPFQRELIERAFGVKVFNWYGNSEMCANIVECEKGEMHLKLEHSYVEVLDEHDNPCGPGETGRLVCTGFGNYAFPLVRYDVGDLVTVSKLVKSRCGRGGLLINEVVGREEDYIFTPDGRMVGRLDHLFKGVDNVIEAQLQQDKLDELTIRIVKSSTFTRENEFDILRQARQRLGDAIRLKVEYVDAIPRGKNGKFRFIQSALNQQAALRELVQ